MGPETKCAKKNPKWWHMCIRRFHTIASRGLNFPVWSCTAESCAWQMASRLELSFPHPHPEALPVGVKQHHQCPAYFHFKWVGPPSRNVSIFPHKRSNCRSEDVLTWSQNRFSNSQKVNTRKQNPFCLVVFLCLVCFLLVLGPVCFALVCLLLLLLPGQEECRRTSLEQVGLLWCVCSPDAFRITTTSVTYACVSLKMYRRSKCLLLLSIKVLSIHDRSSNKQMSQSNAGQYQYRLHDRKKRMGKCRIPQICIWT